MHTTNCAWLLGFLGLLISLVPTTSVEAGDERELADKIPQLMAALDAEEYSVRELATQALSDIGLASEPALRRAVSESSSYEVRSRASSILQTFEQRKRPSLLQHLAGFHTDHVTMVAFSPDGELLASASEDGTIVVYRWKTAEAWKTLRGHARGVLHIDFSPDGKTLASSGRDSQVLLWNVATGEKQVTIADHFGAVSAVHYSRDGKSLVTAGDDRTVKVFESNGKLRYSLAGHRQPVIATALRADAKVLFSGGGIWGNSSREGEVKAWDLETRRELWSIPNDLGGVWGLDLSPDGKQLAGASLDGTLRIWNAATGAGVAVLKGHTKQAIWVDYMPDGKFLASSSLDGTVRLWNAATYQETALINAHVPSVQRLAFSPRERMLATCGHDNSVRLWRLPE